MTHLMPCPFRSAVLVEIHPHYRLDRHGYVWLNLDWVDTQRVQRPGVPYKPYATQTTYYPSLLWETEGLEVDSAGAPKPKHSPSEALLIGVR